MKIITLNILKGATEKKRFNSIINFIKKEKPEILCLSELNGWEKNDFKTLKYFCKQCNFKNFTYSLSPNNYNVGIFTNFQIKKTKNILNFRNACLYTKILVNDTELSIVNCHLSPKDEDSRLSELKKILRSLKKEKNIIILGDLNSLSNDDKYKKELLDNLKKQRISKFGTKVLRTNVIKKIKSSNFVDLVKIFSTDFEYTVPTPFSTDEHHLDKLRLDYIFCSKKLASFCQSARIIRKPETDSLSDHYPVVAEFKL